MFKIENGRLSFYQWDTNQRLIIEDASINEVHFCNRTSDCSLVCEVYEENGLRLVDVPNILLQDDWTIRVYAYCTNYTKIEEKFLVLRRSKPADYIYTETEIKTFARLENRMDELEATVSVEGIAQAVEDYLIANPVEAGATAEEKEKIENNSQKIRNVERELIDLERNTLPLYALKTELPSIEGLASEGYVNTALSNYYTKAQTDTAINAAKPDLTPYAKKSELPTVPTNISAFNNDKGYQTAADVTAIVKVELGVIENGTY